jgi:hypothetical protein
MCCGLEVLALLCVLYDQIDDLEEVSEYMAKCFPPDYKIFSFYEERYQKWLYSRFVARIGTAIMR